MTEFELYAALEDLIEAGDRETREHYSVRVDFPPGAEDHRPWLLQSATRLAGDDHLTILYQVLDASTAVLLASAVARDWTAVLGVPVTATALRATWLLVSETEIATDPPPEETSP